MHVSYNLLNIYTVFGRSKEIKSSNYIRENKIIHRDLTFSNVIMDKDKYFNLIDFSFSIDYSKRNLSYLKCNTDKSDTPPEILSNSEYDYNSDYYRLGFIIFFLVFKKYPWNIKKQKNLTELFIEYNLKGKYSKELLDFLKQLSITNIKKRLGYKNINELINHPWFKGFNWKKLEQKKIISPFYNKKIISVKTICNNFVKNEKMIERYKSLIKSDDYIKL